LADRLGSIQDAYPAGTPLLVQALPLQRVILAPPRDMVETAFQMVNASSLAPATWFYIAAAEVREGKYEAAPDTAPWRGAAMVGWLDEETPVDCTRMMLRLLEERRVDDSFEMQPMCRGSIRWDVPAPGRKADWHLHGKIRKICLESMKLW
ncbi:hypothetical protein JW905_18485, partial [bacterium]|nr:hypothetical protein [candidate division CSSED10-310 bacterium]